ncbi:MAG: hypothetical protein IJQ73_01465 [Kiritimatiellae bacterium]|nr:hypothetical protein [Kiritimatiellia bacterium]
MEKRMITLLSAMTLGVLANAADIPWRDGTAGEALTVPLAAGDRLVLPAEDHVVPASALTISTSSAGTAEVDGGAGGWTFGLGPNDGSWSYAATPFQLAPAGIPLLSIARGSADAASGPVFSVSNGLFRLVYAENAGDLPSAELHFDRGAWNASTPYGSAALGSCSYLGGATMGDPLAESRTYIHGGSFEFANATFGATARDYNLLQIDGGRHVVRDNFSFGGVSGRTWKTFDRTYDMVLSGPGTSLDVCGRLFFAANAAGANLGDLANVSAALTITNGATFQAWNGQIIMGTTFKRLDVVVADGGSFIATNATTTFANHSAGYKPITIAGDGGDVRFNAFRFGTSPVTVALTNATLFTRGSLWTTGSQADLELVDGDTTLYEIIWGGPSMRVKGGSLAYNWTAQTVDHSPADSVKPAITFDGADIYAGGNWPQAFSIANTASGYGSVTATGGTRWRGGSVNVAYAASSTGSFELSGGSEFVTRRGFSSLSVGHGSGSTGRCLISDSTVLNDPGATDYEWLIAGNGGDGAVDISASYVSNHVGYATIAKTAASTGMLALSNGTTMVINKIAGGAGTSTLVADGAVAIPKLMKNKTVVEDFISGIGAAKLGARGLTVLTDYATTISQSFSDMAGRNGLLVLAGPGFKTLTGTSSHAVTRVAQGRARIAASQLSTIDVAGATLDLADGAATAVSYGGLATDASAVIALDSSDTITTTLAPVFGSVNIALGDTPADGTYTLVRTAAAVPQATVAAWEGGYVQGGRQDGKMYAFSVGSYNGETLFNLTVADAASLGETVWTGAAGNGLFATGGNWDGGAAPTRLDVAKFPGSAAAKAVTVAGDETVAAIDIDSADSYAIGGQGSLTLFDTGAGYISADGGAHEIAASVGLRSTTDVSVGAGASLEISGDIDGGAVAKSGGGRLVLSGEGNAFMDDLAVSAGTLAVASPGAAGIASGARSSSIVLEGGTFEYNGDAQEAETLGRRLVVNPGASTAAVADIETPLVVNALSMQSGSFIKRGPGKLTFDLSQNTSVSIERGRLSHLSPGTTFTFPSTGGMAETGNFAGFSVAEGTVEFTGPSSTVLNGGSGTYIDIGLNAANGSADPELILNGVQWGDNASFQMGAASAGAFAGKFTYRVINGARHSGNGLYMVGADNGADDSSDFHIAVEDGSQLVLSYDFRPPQLQYGRMCMEVLGGSALAVPSLAPSSPFAIRVEDSTFSKWGGAFTSPIPGSDPVEITLGYYAVGAFHLKNADFRVNAVNRKTRPNYNTVYSTNGIAFNFDNVAWNVGDNDVSLLLREAETVAFNVQEGGLVISNNAGRAFTTASPFTGVGKLAKGGDGTLVFDVAKTEKGTPTLNQARIAETNALARSYTLDVEGGLDVFGGTVCVSAASMRPGLDVHVASGAVLDLGGDTIEVASLSGAGTVRNGTLVVGTLKVDVDAGVITLDDATIQPGRVLVDFGRTAEDPLAVKTVDYGVVRFANAAAPDYTRWKAANTGVEGVAGRFFTDGDLVKVTIQRIGATVLLLR